MSVFTIYNCGTSYDENSKDVIAKLFWSTQGGRGKDKLICAGPGSKAFNHTGYDPWWRPGFYKEDAKPLLRQITLPESLGGAEVVGAFAGWPDVEKNVKLVVEGLKNLEPKPGIINMAGWSRGACTCHAIANAMSRSKDTWLRGVPVNIFAFDPVPGTGNFLRKDWRHVPANVANYQAIFMENENRGIMTAAQLSFESKNTSRKLLHMPGGHWFAVENVTGVEEVAKVGGHLAEEFLHTWGTEFKAPSLIMPPLVLLELYALMIQHTENFFGKGKVDIYRETGSNMTTFKMSNHLLASSPYFVNAHHKQVFKLVAPTVYKYYFVHQIFDESRCFDAYTESAVRELAQDPRTRRELITELQGLKGKAPRTWETLHEFAKYVGAPRAKVLQMQSAQKQKSGGDRDWMTPLYGT